jgi:hypothetical protein
MRDVEKIIERFRELHPAVKVSQLKVLHPGADDDGLWFFSHCESAFEVQIESPNGMCPFLIETDESDVRFTNNSIQETVQTVSGLLHLPRTETSLGH